MGKALRNSLTKFSIETGRKLDNPISFENLARFLISDESDFIRTNGLLLGGVRYPSSRLPLDGSVDEERGELTGVFDAEDESNSSRSLSRS